jgi:hypothetical protein
MRDNNDTWIFERGDFFANLTRFPIPFDLKKVDIEKLFGTTKADVVTELFRVGEGKLGYYVADLLDKRYYYCGTSENDLKAKFVELGIG